jgi:putative ABC transport system substrate-binding protein
MNRRDVFTAVGGALVAVLPPIGARAQQSIGRLPHIAYLGAQSPTALDPRQIEAFKSGLAENGLAPDRTISIDYLWAEGSADRLRRLAAELANGDLDVIVTAGPQLVRALIEAKARAPIVFAILNDPIADGFVQSFASGWRNLISRCGAARSTHRRSAPMASVPDSASPASRSDPLIDSEQFRMVPRTLRPCL